MPDIIFVSYPAEGGANWCCTPCGSPGTQRHQQWHAWRPPVSLLSVPTALAVAPHGPLGGAGQGSHPTFSPGTLPAGKKLETQTMKDIMNENDHIEKC